MYSMHHGTHRLGENITVRTEDGKPTKEKDAKKRKKRAGWRSGNALRLLFVR
jgi:hypothetical protein